MANLTETKENLIRQAVKTFIESKNLDINVFDRRRFFASRKSYAAAIGVQISEADKLEVRYLFIEYLSFEDSTVLGFDDCPAIILIYRLHLFLQFADERPNGSNSERDFMNAILTLRDGFLQSREFSGAKCAPITPEEFANFGAEAITESNGHSQDFILRITYYDKSAS